MTKHAAKPAEQPTHTPGPWHRRIGRKGNGDERSQEEQLCNEAGVAALLIMHDGSPEGEANANVATVAPELLDALTDLTDMSIDDWTTANRASNSPEAAKLRNAFAAIAKATGGVS